MTKRAPADSSTAWAQGGVACVWSSEDTFESHVQDTLEAGAGLCDEAAVRTIVGDGPTRIRELIALGVHFDEREIPLGNGATELDLGREGGHSKRRVLHSQDTTGREIERILLAAVAAHPNIKVLERHMAVDLITSAKLGAATENRCLGVYVLIEDTGEVETFRTPRMVLATGGCGKVYLYTTNPSVATGDGVAMAWRAGAAIATWSSSSSIRRACFTRKRGRSSSRRPCAGRGASSRMPRARRSWINIIRWRHWRRETSWRAPSTPR